MSIYLDAILISWTGKVPIMQTLAADKDKLTDSSQLVFFKTAGTW